MKEILRLVGRLASHLCDGTCATASRLAARCAGAESNYIDAKRDVDALQRRLDQGVAVAAADHADVVARAYERAESDWASRHSSVLAAKQELERRVNHQVGLLERAVSHLLLDPAHDPELVAAIRQEVGA